MLPARPYNKSFRAPFYISVIPRSSIPTPSSFLPLSFLYLGKIMIIVSSLFEYATSILREPQRTKPRLSSIVNEGQPGAEYELMDDARHDSRPPAPSPTDANAAPLRCVAMSVEQEASGCATPQSEEGKRGGRESAAESKRRRNHKYKVLFGLALPFALQSLDTTIIASALPFIAADFGTLTQCSAHTKVPRREKE